MRMYKIIIIILLCQNNLFSQSPGGVGTANITSWFKADNLAVGNVVSWTSSFPTGANSITLTDPNNSDYAQATNTPLGNVSNYNMTIDFSNNLNNKSLTNTGDFDLLNNYSDPFNWNPAPIEGTLFFSFLSQSPDPNGHMLLYNENEGDGDAIQLRLLGSTSIRLAIGKSFTNSTNACRNRTYNYLPTIIGYKGNRTNANSMNSFNDDYFFTDNSASQSSGTKGIYIGRHSSANNSYYDGYINEMITFNRDLTNTEITKVNTYLGVKFGITLENTGGGTQGDYISTNNTLIWDASLTPNYHNDVIGIGRDDDELLLQKQSHSFDDITRVYIDALQNTNVLNLGNFTNNNSYLILGHNSGVMCSTPPSNIEIPIGSSLTERLDREWKVTKTNFNQSFSVDLTLTACPSFTSALPSNLRLLVDNDGDFTNATVYSQADGILFVINGDIISVSDIDNLHIQNNSTKYFTIGVVTEPTAEFTLNSTTICEGDSITFTDISTGVNITSWNWDFIAGTPNNSLTQGPHVITFNTAGIYNIKLEIIDGIFVDDTIVQITVKQTPTTEAGVDQIICENQSVILSASNPQNGVLSWNNGVINNVGFTPNIGIEQYNVSVDINGCIVEDSLLITVIENPNFVTTIDNTIETCLGTEGSILITGLTANQSYTLTYSNNGILTIPANFISDNNGNIHLSNLNEGAYSDFNISLPLLGCSSIDNTILNLTDPLPPLVNAGDDIMVCDDELIVLTAINPNDAQISWDNDVMDNTGFLPNLGQTTYTVIAELNNCFATDQVEVLVNPNPTINAGIDQVVCIGDSLKLEATSTETLINWNNLVTNNSYFIPEISSEYIATVIDVNGCSSSDTVFISVMNKPNANFIYSPSQPTVQSLEVNFSAINNDLEYFWNFGNNVSGFEQIENITYPDIPGQYYNVSLIVKDTNNCIDSSSVQIFIADLVIYYVPNAFTPDGDNLNNVFKPIFTSGYDPYDYHLIIFNRWGEIIFESYNSEIGWDGTKNGVKVQDGIYVYSIEFGILLTDERKKITGTVTLLK